MHKKAGSFLSGWPQEGGRHPLALPKRIWKQILMTNSSQTWNHLFSRFRLFSLVPDNKFSFIRPSHHFTSYSSLLAMYNRRTLGVNFKKLSKVVTFSKNIFKSPCLHTQPKIGTCSLKPTRLKLELLEPLVSLVLADFQYVQLEKIGSKKKGNKKPVQPVGRCLRHVQRSTQGGVGAPVSHFWTF